LAEAKLLWDRSILHFWLLLGYFFFLLAAGAGALRVSNGAR
jgi:hypothetical protein